MGCNLFFSYQGQADLRSKKEEHYVTKLYVTWFSRLHSAVTYVRVHLNYILVIQKCTLQVGETLRHLMAISL